MARDVQLTIKVNDADVKKAEASITRLNQVASTSQRTSGFGGVAPTEDAEQQRKLKAFLGQDLPAAAKKTEEAMTVVKTASAGAEAGFVSLSSVAGPVGIAIAAVGAAIVVTAAVIVEIAKKVYQLTKAFADHAIQIGNAAEQNGILLHTYIALKTELDSQGRSYVNLEGAISNFRKTVGLAVAGSKEAREHLKLLGQDGKLAIYNIDDSLKKAMITIAKAPEGIKQVRMANAAFLDQGPEMLKFIRDFHGDTGKLNETLKQLGVNLSEDDVRGAREFNRAYNELSTQVQSITDQFGKNFMPIVTGALKAVNNFLKSNQSAISTWSDNQKTYLAGVSVYWDKLIEKIESYHSWLKTMEKDYPTLFAKTPDTMQHVGQGLAPEVLGALQQTGRGTLLRGSVDGALFNSDPVALAAAMAYKPKKEKITHELSPQAKAIIDAATAIGVSPLDYATLLLYEGAGSLSTSQFGGAGNRYLGPMQMGPWEQGHYKVKPGMPLPDYLKKANEFLGDRGVMPGASLLQMYEAVLGGHVGVGNVRDMNGSLNEHLTRMLRDRRPQAEKMFKGFAEEGKPVSDDIKRMMEQQSNQMTKEARDTLISEAIDVWYKAGFIPDGQTLSDFQQALADQSKQYGQPQSTSADVKAMFIANWMNKLGAVTAPNSTVAGAGAMNLRPSIDKQYIADLTEALNLDQRRETLVMQRRNAEAEISTRMQDQILSQQEALQQAQTELRLAEQRNDQLDIEVAHIQDLIEFRNRDKDAVIAINKAQLEISHQMEISNNQIRAGVYEHLAQQRSMSQAIADGINQTYDSLQALVTGPLDKLNEKTHGLLSFITEPLKAYESNRLTGMFTGLLDRIFPGAGSAMNKAQNPVLGELEDHTRLLTRIANAVDPSGTGVGIGGLHFPGGGFGGGGMGPGGTPYFNPGGGGSIFSQVPGSTGSIDANGNYVVNGNQPTGILGNLRALFSTQKGGIFAPINGSKVAGIGSGIGMLATLAGGLVGGRTGTVLSMAGTGAQIGAMFGPWGMAIGAGVGALAGLISSLFGSNNQRKQDEGTRNQAMLDAQGAIRQQFDDLITQVKFGNVDAASALNQGRSIGSSVRDQYLQVANSLKDKKTRNIALSDVSRIDTLIQQKMDELSGVAEMASASADRMKRILPEFAGGVFMSDSFSRYNGMLGGNWSGRDYRMALLADAEMVLNPMQQANIRRAAGFDVFAGAGIPNYPNANPSSGLAGGGVVSASSPQILVQTQPTIVLQGVSFTDATRAYIVSDDGTRTLVKLINDKNKEGLLNL